MMEQTHTLWRTGLASQVEIAFMTKEECKEFKKWCFDSDIHSLHNFILGDRSYVALHTKEDSDLIVDYLNKKYK